MKNYWIRCATDPPFSKEMLQECKSLEELEENLKWGNWSLGQGFYYDTLCFINQINAGDEWLAIRWNVAFDSITFRKIIKSGQFIPYINKILDKKREELKGFEY